MSPGHPKSACSPRPPTVALDARELLQRLLGKGQAFPSLPCGVD